MNEDEWEYILLHSLPREWAPMTDEKSDDLPETITEAEEATGDKATEGEEVSGNGSTGKTSTNTEPNTDGGTSNTHGVGQGTEAQSGGREHTPTSGNTPGEPVSVPAGDAGKNPDGSWRTRKDSSERKSFGFQKRNRARKEAKR